MELQFSKFVLENLSNDNKQTLKVVCLLMRIKALNSIVERNNYFKKSLYLTSKNYFHETCRRPPASSWSRSSTVSSVAMLGMPVILWFTAMPL